MASIEREGASIVIRDREGRRSNLPLHLLDRIVIRGTVGLDTSVLGHLARIFHQKERQNLFNPL